AESVSSFRPSTLRAALLNAYSLRSGYVHRLQPLKRHLRLADLATGDTFELDRDVYPTVRGMIRICIEVLENFFWSSPQLKTESVAWRQELSGIIEMKWDPQYWIGEVRAFDENSSAEWFGGVMQHLLDVMSGELKAATDIRAQIQILAEK